MKKLFKGLIVLCGCGLLFVACNRTPEEKANYFVKKVVNHLDLQKDQTVKLHELKDQLLLIRRDRSQDKKEMHKDIKTFLLSEKIEASDVKDLIERKEKIISEEFSGVFSRFQAFHASLSQAQKEKAVGLLEKFHNKHNCND